MKLYPFSIYFHTACSCPSLPITPFSQSARPILSFWIFFFFLWPHLAAWVILVPQPGIELCPLQCMLGVLMTGPPEKPPFFNRCIWNTSYVPGPVLDTWNLSVRKLWSLSSILSEYFLYAWPQHPECFQVDLSLEDEHMLVWSRVAWRTTRCSGHLGLLQSRVAW